MLMAGCGDTDPLLTVGATGDWTATEPGPGSPTSDSPTTSSTSETSEATETSSAETGPSPTETGPSPTETDATTTSTTQPVTTDEPTSATSEVDPPDPPTCDDNKKNGDETGVDCGGSCEACPPGPQPDLYVDYFYVDEHVLESGYGTEMHFSVANAGKVDTEFQFDIRVVLSKNETIGDEDDIILFDWLYPYAVEAEGDTLWKEYFVLPETAYDGGYFIGMALDFTDIIAESNEANNTLFDAEQLVVWNNPKPVDIDLSPVNALATEYQVLQGAEATFTFDVANLGTGDAPAYSVGLYYSEDPEITTADTLICTYEDVDGLAGMAQEAQEVTCDVPKLVGARYFGVIVDPADAEEELDENNNVAADPAPVTITAPDVDLQPSAVTASDLSVDTGQQVTVSATVTNAGTDPSPVFEVSFYLSSDAQVTKNDHLICSTTSQGALAPGAQVMLSPACAVPPVASGSYWLGAIADGADQITESDEGNNTAVAAGKVAVTAPDVDLEYELLWDDANNLSPGETVPYHLQIRNKGTAASPAQFAVSVYYSLDMNINFLDAEACTVNVGMVPALTITEFEFDCKVPNLAPEWYYNGVIIDSSNIVPETDETNNVGSSVNPELIQ
nr:MULTISPECIES: CARDB domain-containing protein [unclassified Nannocystis]